MEKIWRESPWSAQVCQADFQRWILPYRCADEMVDFEGDSLLKQMYAPLIEGVNNPKEAFRIISKRIYDTIRECNSDCPYILDAYTINYIRQANCEQRCVLLVHILRQLGIPCCIDRIPFWGNYSTVGHSWVAMAFEGKTYVYDDSSKDGSVREASSGPIDAALFPVTYRPDVSDKFPYPLKNQKEVTKIYRNSAMTDQQSDSLFAYSGYEDVSNCYGFKHVVRKQVELQNGMDSICYLCAFRTGASWQPIAKASIDNTGMVTFIHVNPNVMYVISGICRGRLIALTNPFYGSEPETEFVPQKGNEKITVCRKYPVFSYWTNQWGNMKGSTFEASDDSDFNLVDTIGIIERMPYGFMAIVPNSNGRYYRYFRYHASNRTRTPLSELRVYNKDGEIHGSPISKGLLPGLEKAPFDGNVLSISSSKKTGYWVGLDFGVPQQIDSISFLAKNDGNDVQTGHRYELYYFDKKWKSLGSKVALSNTLRYYVPQNALLLLKDRTTGVEERPFLYDSENNVQIWF